MQNITQLTEQTIQQNNSERKSDKTTGERLFIATDYYGLGWIANAGIGVVSTEYAFNRPDNFLFTARTKAVDCAVNIARSFFQDEKLNELTKTIGQKLTELSEHTDIGNILSNHGNDTQYKQAFYQLHDKLKGYEGLAEHLGEGFDAKSLKQVADYMIKKEATTEVFNKAAVLGTLCIGGFAVMIPMKIMEDNKRAITEFLDNKVIDPINAMIGKAAPTEQEQQQRQQRYAEIEAEPAQTWKSMLTSRIVSMIPLYALHMSWWSENNAVKYAGGLATGAEITNPSPSVGFGGMAHYSKQAGDFVGTKVHDILPDGTKASIGKYLTTKATAFGENEDVNEKIKAWTSQKAEWIMTDVAYSLVVANATYGFTKIFGKMFDKNHHEASDKPLSPPSAQVAKIEHDGAVQSNNKELQFAF